MPELSLKNRRVVILFGSLDMGGAERQGLILARHLKEDQKADMQVWGLGNSRGAIAVTCEAWGIPWKSVWLHWGLRRRLPHLLRLALHLKQEKPDILLSYTKVPNIAAALLWRICGVKLCVWNQSDAGLLLEPTLLNRFAIARIDHFISNAEGGRRYLLEKFNLEQDKVMLIRNGVALPPPLTNRAGWRTKLDANDGRVVVTMIANLSRFKDHATLLEAWKRVLERACNAPSPLLVLAGRFDDQTESLRQQADRLSIAKHVRFLGEVDDVCGLLQASDICVHSSRSEGIPNAILEAMLCALPVTGSNIPGIREAVGEEGESYLAEPGDAAVLADQLCRLIDNPELRDRQGKRMRQRVDKQFGEERMCRETIHYLTKTLGELS